MALVACPECSKQISDAAASCPHCGYALAGPSNGAKTLGDGSTYVTSQGTSKSLKLQSALALLLVIVGLVGLFSGGGEGTDPSGIWPLMVLVGLIWGIGVRVLKWWRHA